MRIYWTWNLEHAHRLTERATYFWLPFNYDDRSCPTVRLLLGTYDD